MKTRLLILAALATVFSSCEKFLDTTPTSFTTPGNFYSNEVQLQTALNGVYDVLTSDSFLYGPFGTNLALKFGFTTDEGFSPQYVEMLFNFDASSAAVAGTWKGLYTGVGRANLLLSKIDGVNMDEKKKNIIKGQALFLRGYYYYLLAVCYGDVPLVLSPATSINGDLSVARTPVKEIYGQVLQDMNAAEVLLRNAGFTSKSLGYAEKVTVDAVWGILAKVSLTMASPGISGKPIDASKYADVVLWADKLLSSADHALNPSYKQVFINMLQDKYDVKESIWEAGLYGNTSTEGSNYVFYTAIRNSPGGGQGTATVTRKLFSSYAVWDSVRCNWNCANFFYTSTPTSFSPPTTTITNAWNYQVGKWRRIYENSFTGIGGVGQSSYNATNMPLLRLADVYLMKAEALNEMDKPAAEVCEAINPVRRRAFKIPTNQANATCDVPVTLNKEQLRQEIRAERMRELCFEGIRKWDQVRWGTYYKDLVDIGVAASDPLTGIPSTGTFGNQRARLLTACSAVSPKHFLLPIPTIEMQLNTKLTQNPGW